MKLGTLDKYLREFRLTFALKALMTLIISEAVKLHQEREEYVLCPHGHWQFNHVGKGTRTSQPGKLLQSKGFPQQNTLPQPQQTLPSRLETELPL